MRLRGVESNDVTGLLNETLRKIYESKILLAVVGGECVADVGQAGIWEMACLNKKLSGKWQKRDFPLSFIFPSRPEFWTTGRFHLNDGADHMAAIREPPELIFLLRHPIFPFYPLQPLPEITG